MEIDVFQNKCTRNDDIIPQREFGSDIKRFFYQIKIRKLHSDVLIYSRKLACIIRYSSSAQP